MIKSNFIYPILFIVSILIENINAQNQYTPVPGQSSGYTPGSFNITDGGAANYSFSIEVPRGSGGTTPQIGLTYSSQGGNGPLGMGWQLTGLSTISRVGQTISQDRMNRPVRFDNSDRLALDGERLVSEVPDTNIYWQSGNNYFTEQLNHSRIRSIGSASWGGPNSFRVWTKDGVIMDYETKVTVLKQGSMVTAYWLLSRVSDTKGNFFNLQYTINSNDGYFELDRINYTGNSAANITPYASIRFEYENRSDFTKSYTEGILFHTNKRRIRSIKVFNQHQLFRNYEILYDNTNLPGNNNFYSRIISIQECGMNGDCHTPTTFQWQNRLLPQFVQHNISNIQIDNDDRLVPVDINGNGVQDLFVVKPSGVFAFRNNRNELNPGFTQIGTGPIISSQGITDARYLFGDFNGDAKVDIFRYSNQTGANNIFLNATSLNDPGATFIQQGGVGSSHNSLFQNSQNRTILAQDINGDGRTDIFVIDFGAGNGQNNWFINDRNQGASASFSHFANRIPPSSLSPFLSDATYQPHFLDFNGDGFMDVLFTSSNTGQNTTSGGRIRLLRSNALETGNAAYSFNLLSESSLVSNNSLISGPGNEVVFIPMDGNGDGLTDIFWYNKQNGNNRWLINTGMNLLTIGSLNTIPSSNLQGFDQVIPNDFNSDGNLDLVIIRESNGNSHWLAGSGDFIFSPSIQNFITPAQIALYSLANIGNMTGKTSFDLLFFQKNISNSLRLFKNIQAKQNFISRINIGSGQSIDINYEFLTDVEVFKKSEGSVYPTLDLQATQLAVSHYSTNDGVGGFREMYYKYEGAKVDITGRGFRGFSKIENIDGITGITQIREFETGPDSYKFVNAPLKKSTTKISTGAVINETIYENDIKNYYPITFAGQTFFRCHYSFTKKITSREFEIYGSAEPIRIKTITNEYDDFGNVTYLVTDLGGGYKDSLYNVYANIVNPNSWLLGRLLTSELHRYAPGQNTIVRKTAFEYMLQDGSGLLFREITEPDSSSLVKTAKEYQYDIYGNIINSKLIAWNGEGSNTEERSNVTLYDSQGRFTISASNSLGHTYNMVNDPLTGHVLTETNPNGYSINHTYDNFGRKVRIDKSDGNWQTMDYRKCGSGQDCPSFAVHFIYQQASDEAPSIIYYDLHNREVRNARKGFNGSWIFSDTEYDVYGQIIRTTQPYFENETPKDTLFYYDIAGRRVKIVAPGGAVDSIYYAPNGFEKVFINAAHQSKKLISDLRDLPVRIIDNDGNSIYYTHDAAGRITDIVDENGNVIRMEYDVYGNKTKLIDPDIGTFTYITNGFGEMVRQTDPDGQMIIARYDRLGRMVQRIEEEGISTWTFDTQQNGIGLLASESDFTGFSKTLQYEAFGKLIAENVTIQGESYIQQYSYDNLGRLGELTYPSGFKIRHEYNTYGYLYQVKNATSDEIYWTLTDANEMDMPLTELYGNGAVVTKTYDSFKYLPASFKSQVGNEIIQDEEYQFDAIGNLNFRKDNRLNKVEQFTYDNLNRLIKAKIAGGDSLLMQYDILGNITYKSDVGTYHYGSINNGPRTLQNIELNTNQCIPSFEINTEYYSFDKVKNIVKDSARLEITYGPDRLRNSQKLFINGLLTKEKHYISAYFEKEVQNGQVKNIHYIRGLDSPIAIYVSNENNQASLSYLHRDHLGSVSLITNGTGDVTQRYSYDAWGKRRNADWTSSQDTSALLADRGFTGHEHYDLFDLIDMNGRIYDPVIGRFITADPFIQDLTDLQNLNRFSYVLNNPLSYTDPSGYFFRRIFRAITSVVNAVVNVVKTIGNLVLDYYKFIAHVAKVGAKWAKENWQTIVIVAVAITVSALTGGIGGPIIGKILSAGLTGFATGVTRTLLSGGNLGAALEAGLKGGYRGLWMGTITMGLDGGVMALKAQKMETLALATKTIGSGLIKGAVNSMDGDKFLHGFVAGSFDGVSKDAISSFNNGFLEIASTSVVGGTVGLIVDGKFMNGAESAGFGKLINKVDDYFNGASIDRKFGTVNRISADKHFTKKELKEPKFISKVGVPGFKAYMFSENIQYNLFVRLIKPN